MTRKDWKKNGRDGWQKGIYSHNPQYVYISQTPAKTYVVIYINGYPLIPKIYKRTKSKSQALKFAKQYMRTH